MAGMFLLASCANVPVGIHNNHSWTIALESRDGKKAIAQIGEFIVDGNQVWVCDITPDPVHLHSLISILMDEIEKRTSSVSVKDVVVFSPSVKIIRDEIEVFAQKVILIPCDMRLPTEVLGKITGYGFRLFGVQNSFGFPIVMGFSDLNF